MKYLFSLLLVGMSFITIAQNRDGNIKGYNNFTPEQNAELQTKKLTLALELTTAQQKQVFEINKKSALELNKRRESMIANKENGKTMTSDERFKMMSDRIDEMIAMQNEMKEILNKNQYEKWKDMKEKKNMSFENSRKQKQGTYKKRYHNY